MKLEISLSVGSVWRHVDNILMETNSGLFKAEVTHRRSPLRSFETVEYATLKWVDSYSHRRHLVLIGNIPPTEFEARYHTHAHDQAYAA